MPKTAKLSKSERHGLIMQRLQTSPALRISELASDIGVSGETIRRDLTELGKLGLISRTYGGAARPLAADPAPVPRSPRLGSELSVLAKAACAHVKERQIVILGSGSTVLQVGVYLAANFKELMIFTDSILIADAMSTNPGITVRLCPGIYSDEHKCVYGVETVEYLTRIYADVAILGAAGLSEHGPSCHDLSIGGTYSQMIKSSGHSVVAADHSKISKQQVYTYAPWGAIDTLICDMDPDDERLAEALRFGRVQVEVAGGKWAGL